MKRTPLQEAATKAKAWLWEYVADCEEMSPTATEAAGIANELEAAINLEQDAEKALEQV